MTTFHGTCVLTAGVGVLLRGQSGSGKSDLALRLIEQGAILVADDRVVLTAADGCLFAQGPERLAGLIEVRGVGIMKVPATQQAVVALIVDMVQPGAIERMPEAEWEDLCGVRVARLRLTPFETSATAKLNIAAAAARDGVLGKAPELQ
ncbi:HPr kinase/phosphorylase [Azospirillaceae bacterium]